MGEVPILLKRSVASCSVDKCNDFHFVLQHYDVHILGIQDDGDVMDVKPLVGLS